MPPKKRASTASDKSSSDPLASSSPMSPSSSEGEGAPDPFGSLNHAVIPDNGGTVVVKIQPPHMSLSQSTAHMIDESGKTIATMKTKSKGFAIPLAMFGAAISTIIINAIVEKKDKHSKTVAQEALEFLKARFKNSEGGGDKKDEEGDDPNKWVRETVRALGFPHLKSGAVVGLTLGIGAPLAMAAFRKPDFFFENAERRVTMVAKYKRSAGSWVIQHKPQDGFGVEPKFVYVLTPNPQSSTFDLTVEDNQASPDMDLLDSIEEEGSDPESDAARTGSGSDITSVHLSPTPRAPVVRIPMIFKTGLEFGAQSSFRARVERLNRFRFDLGSTGHKIALPLIGSQESYELRFEGPSEVPRDVLAFCTYMVRTVNILPLDLFLYVVLGVGATNLIAWVIDKFRGRTNTELRMILKERVEYIQGNEALKGAYKGAKNDQKAAFLLNTVPQLEKISKTSDPLAGLKEEGKFAEYKKFFNMQELPSEEQIADPSTIL